MTTIAVGSSLIHRDKGHKIEKIMTIIDALKIDRSRLDPETASVDARCDKAERALDDLAKADARKKGRVILEFLTDRDSEENRFVALFAYDQPHHERMHKAFLDEVLLDEPPYVEPGETVVARTYGSAALTATVNAYENGQLSDISYMIVRDTELAFSD